jgi:outer membrane protein W
MKKIFILSMACVLCLSVKTFAQNLAFDEDYSSISINYGFFDPDKKGFKHYEPFEGQTIKFNAIGPFGIGYEKAISDVMSMGLQIGYSTFKIITTTKDGISTGNDLVVNEKINHFSVAAKFNYHFIESEKFDPYFGSGLVYRKYKYTRKYNDAAFNNETAGSALPKSFAGVINLGVRYYFTSAIGVYTELGYLAGSLMQVGVTAKF